MTHDELREKVMRLYADKWGVTDAWLADAAIAIIRAETLEEAAKAVENYPYEHWDVTDPLAAAIRSMKEEK